MEQQFQGSREEPRPTERGTAAIDRGAELLVRVLESDEPVALADLAAASGIPKSTASRLLSALERQGLITQDGLRGRLRPGPAILRVAARSLLERSVTELAGPSLDALGELTGETVNLAVPAPQGVEHLAQVESRHFLGAGQWLGRTVDYHCTAVGKIFMAFGRAPLPAAPPSAMTARTITSPSRLRDELATVRAESFAAAVDELEIGLAAIAAPVTGAGGEVVAALSISGPTIRMTDARIAQLRPILIDEARALSDRLGDPPSPIAQGADAA
ncbi:MAG: IclR family transcriptional regulator [Solirubrobacterales bacterium]|nr:IclR family transcriptional regulator [Solirubrobacterales bacterium]